MSWHPECFKKNFLYTANSIPTKWECRCQAGKNCSRGGYIKLGENFCYDVKGSLKEQSERTASIAAIEAAAQAREAASAAEKAAREANAPRALAPGEGVPTISKVEIQTMVSEETAAYMTFKVQSTISKEIADNLSLLIPTLTNEIVDKVSARTAITVKVATPSGEIKDCGLQHKQFPTLLKAVVARVNVWLAGPSASGKTTAAQNVAKSLGLPFLYTGAVGDPYALNGYNDANGKYVRTPFREAYEHGGLFLWDEIDASDPNALLAFNAALANDTCPFPDGIIKKHKDCVMIAAANTWGHGATQEYVGRLKMDNAFLKRFAFISWDYDPELELATAPNREWTLRVQSIRKKVADKGLRVMVTPRESYIGAQLLAAGIDQDTVEQMTIKSGMTNEQWKSINIPSMTTASSQPYVPSTFRPRYA